MKKDAVAFQETFQQSNTLKQIDVNSNWKQLKSNISDMLDKHVPQNTVKQKWDVPWTNPQIKNK